MKKLKALSLMLVMTMSVSMFAACGNTDSQSSETSEPAAATADAAPAS